MYLKSSGPFIRHKGTPWSTDTEASIHYPLIRSNYGTSPYEARPEPEFNVQEARCPVCLGTLCRNLG